MKRQLQFLLVLMLMASQAVLGATYQLWVGDVQVTSDNASNITFQGLKSGTISYNANTKILTLTNVDMSISNNGIANGIDNLKIYVKGVNNLKIVNGEPGIDSYKSLTIYADYVNNNWLNIETQGYGIVQHGGKLTIDNAGVTVKGSAADKYSIYGDYQNNTELELKKPWLVVDGNGGGIYGFTSCSMLQCVAYNDVKPEMYDVCYRKASKGFAKSDGTLAKYVNIQGGWSKDHGIKILGTPLTSMNDEHFATDGLTGSVTYDEKEHILSLDNATLSLKGGVKVYGIYSDSRYSLNVTGTNRINTELSALFLCDENVEIMGDGTLSLKSDAHGLDITNNTVTIGCRKLSIEADYNGITSENSDKTTQVLFKYCYYDQQARVKGAVGSIRRVNMAFDGMFISSPANAVWQNDTPWGQKLTKPNGDYITGWVEVKPLDIGLTVTAKSYTREYGEENPTFGYDVVGGTLVGEPNIYTRANPFSPVGIYDLNIDKGTILNDSTKLVPGKLTITKAPLKVKVGTYTRKQGEANPAFKLIYEGFKNDDTEDVLKQKPQVTCRATANSEPGEYDIVVSGGSADNYNLSYINGKLIVIEADAVVVTANDYTREYGEENPTFDYTTVGVDLTGEPAITCEATATSPVGTYPIVVTKGRVTNYNDSYVNGTLTITKAPLTIMARECGMYEGNDLPEFELTYEGFKNGENEDVLTVKPTVTCSATKSSKPGEYEIIVSGAEAENYDITYVPGILTIEENPQWVKLDQSVYTISPYTEDMTVIDVEADETGTVNIADSVDYDGKKYPVTKIKKGTFKNKVRVEKVYLASRTPLEFTDDEEEARKMEAAGSGESHEFDDLDLDKCVLYVPYGSEEAYSKAYGWQEFKNIVGEHSEKDPAATITAKDYSREYGEPNPMFEFTAEGAALDGELDISCVATVTSAVGTYDIVVSKGSVKNYNDTYVNGTLTITKAPLTVKVKNYTMKQGGTMPTFEVDYQGFKNSETEAVLTKLPTVTCEATSDSELGEYEITVSGAEAENYEMVYVKGTLTITQADPVVVTAKSYSRQYGGKNPEYDYYFEGAKLNGKPEITCEATATTPVGTYPIVIKKGSVTNYNDSYVNGTLTITKAPLIVQVGSVTRYQGEENPEFTLSYSGFKNGETESVLIKKPVVTTTATKDSPAGEYEIVVSGGEAQNYEFEYINAKLTVKVPTGIEEVTQAGTFDVYDVKGRKVRSQVTTMKGLKKGVYIIRGKKVVMR